MNLRSDKRVQYGLLGLGAALIIIGLTRSASGKAAKVAIDYGKGFKQRLGDMNALPFLVETAAALGVSPAKLFAILKVESAGMLISPVGYIFIRFEPHVFARFSAKHALGLKRNPTAAEIAEHGKVVLLPGMTAAVSSQSRDRTNRVTTASGQTAEWAAFQTAWDLDKEAAASAISMGAGQIMGFNGPDLGYKDAVAMFKDLVYRPAAQLEAFANFIPRAKQGALLDALRLGDYPTFVRLYNGAAIGSTENDNYVQKMIQAELDFMDGDVAI